MDALRSGAIFKLKPNSGSSPVVNSNSNDNNVSGSSFIRSEFDRLARATPDPSRLLRGNGLEQVSSGFKYVQNQLDLVARATPMPAPLHLSNPTSIVKPSPLYNGSNSSISNVHVIEPDSMGNLITPVKRQRIGIPMNDSPSFMPQPTPVDFDSTRKIPKKSHDSRVVWSGEMQSGGGSMKSPSVMPSQSGGGSMKSPSVVPSQSGGGSMKSPSVGAVPAANLKTYELKTKWDSEYDDDLNSNSFIENSPVKSAPKPELKTKWDSEYDDDLNSNSFIENSPVKSAPQRLKLAKKSAKRAVIEKGGQADDELSVGPSITPRRKAVAVGLAGLFDTEPDSQSHPAPESTVQQNFSAQTTRVSRTKAPVKQSRIISAENSLMSLNSHYNMNDSSVLDFNSDQEEDATPTKPLKKPAKTVEKKRTSEPSGGMLFIPLAAQSAHSGTSSSDESNDDSDSDRDVRKAFSKRIPSPSKYVRSPKSSPLSPKPAPMSVINTVNSLLKPSTPSPAKAVSVAQSPVKSTASDSDLGKSSNTVPKRSRTAVSASVLMGSPLKPKSAASGTPNRSSSRNKPVSTPPAVIASPALSPASPPKGKPLASSADIRKNNLMRLQSPPKAMVKPSSPALQMNSASATSDSGPDETEDESEVDQIEGEEKAVAMSVKPEKVIKEKKPKRFTQAALQKIAKSAAKFSENEKSDDIFNMTPGKGLKVPFITAPTAKKLTGSKRNKIVINAELGADDWGGSVATPAATKLSTPATTPAPLVSFGISADFESTPLGNLAGPLDMEKGKSATVTLGKASYVHKLSKAWNSAGSSSAGSVMVKENVVRGKRGFSGISAKDSSVSAVLEKDGRVVVRGDVDMDQE